MQFNLQSVSFDTLSKGRLVRAVMFVPIELAVEFQRLKIPGFVKEAFLEVHFFEQVESMPAGLIRFLDSCGIRQDVLEKRNPALVECYEQGVISVIGFDTIQDYWDKVVL